MKWNKLPDKTPPFKTQLVVWRVEEAENIEGEEWFQVELKSIQETDEGKVFNFETDEGEKIIGSHWGIPIKPKE